MRLPIVFLISAAAAFAGDQEDMLNLAQKTFDAIAAHDGAALESVFLEGASIVSIRDDGRVTTTALSQFAKNLSASKSRLLERMWEPKFLVDGRIGSLWVPYDFHRDGVFSHCGIDHFSFVRTPAGWKIASLSYTHQTKDCRPGPLGAPRP